MPRRFAYGFGMTFEDRDLGDVVEVNQFHVWLTVRESALPHTHIAPFPPQRDEKDSLGGNCNSGSFRVYGYTTDGNALRTRDKALHSGFCIRDGLHNLILPCVAILASGQPAILLEVVGAAK